MGILSGLFGGKEKRKKTPAERALEDAAIFGYNNYKENEQKVEAPYLARLDSMSGAQVREQTQKDAQEMLAQSPAPNQDISRMFEHEQALASGLSDTYSGDTLAQIQSENIASQTKMDAGKDLRNIASAGQRSQAASSATREAGRARAVDIKTEHLIKVISAAVGVGGENIMATHGANIKNSQASGAVGDAINIAGNFWSDTKDWAFGKPEK